MVKYLVCYLAGVSFGNVSPSFKTSLGWISNTDARIGQDFPTYMYKKNTHAAAKPHTCSFCGKTFLQRGNMKIHERVHTGEKPYKCDICGITLNQLSNLKRHKQKIHKLPSN